MSVHLHWLVNLLYLLLKFGVCHLLHLEVGHWCVGCTGDVPCSRGTDHYHDQCRNSRHPVSLQLGSYPLFVTGLRADHEVCSADLALRHAT